jgi:quinohemoprotein ethanol dehydrogenase
MQPTGKEVWRTPIEVWQDGYGITSAPLYYDGIVYSGITGGEFGVRGRLTALDAKTGKNLWRWYTLPAPGEVGSNTWPAGTDHAMRAERRSGTLPLWTPSLDSSTSPPAIADPITTDRCVKATICSAPLSLH